MNSRNNIFTQLGCTRALILLPLLFCTLTGTASALEHSRESAQSQTAVAHITEQKFWKRPQWKKLLYYAPTWFQGERSLIDSHTFFLSARGKSDPRLEMIATVKAFFSPQLKHAPNQHAQCRYPARLAFLKPLIERGTGVTIPTVSCPQLEKYEEAWDDETVSLVFSDYYLGNPVSLFGHVFLRLGARQANNQRGHQLLDLSLSFAADLDGTSSVEALVVGPTGGLKGRFFVNPYYLKVQEYNNAEGRDLWEHSLNFSPEESRRVFLSIWEVATETIDYFYLDDNCALVLLAVLDVGRPSMNLTAKLQNWVTPADTVKVVAEEPGLIQKTEHRPSSLSRFQERYAALKSDEREAFEELLRQRSSESVGNSLELSTAAKSRILDAGLEFLDHSLKLSAAGQPQHESDRQFRSQLLASRARVRVPSPPLQMRPPSPKLGHDTRRMGVSWLVPSDPLNGWSRSPAREDPLLPPALGIDFRAALHDLGSPIDGYPPGVAIEFFHLAASVWPSQGRFQAERATLIGVHSGQKYQALLQNFAWELQLGWERSPCQGYLLRDTSKCGYGFVRGGLGLALAGGAQEQQFVYFHPLHMSAGWHNSQRATADTGAVLGAHFTPWNKSRIHLRSSLSRRFTQASGDFGRFSPHVSLSWAQLLSQNVELRLSTSGQMTTSTEESQSEAWAWGLSSLAAFYSF